MKGGLYMVILHHSTEDSFTHHSNSLVIRISPTKSCRRCEAFVCNPNGNFTC